MKTEENAIEPLSASPCSESLTIPHDDMRVKAAVVWLEHENSDIYAVTFEDAEKAEQWVDAPENEEYKAIIVSMKYIGGGDWKLEIQDRT